MGSFSFSRVLSSFQEVKMKSTVVDLLERRSSRQYSTEQITDEELDTVLKAGLYAPSALNMQSTILVALQDKATISRLSRMNASIMGTDKDPFYGAPTVIIVLGKRSIHSAVQDGSLALGNMMNAAHAIGLGSCWINRAYEEFETDEGRAMLREWGVPGDLIGIGHCILGYPLDLPKDPAPRDEGRVYYVR